MSPEECIASLDRSLASAGEDVVLRRVYGQAPNTVNVDLGCRAAVRSYRLREEVLASAIAQGVLIVTLSPSDIARAQWPGGELPNAVAGVDNPSYPRRGDFVIADEKPRSIQAVDVISVAGEVVRFDMHTVG